MTTLPHILIVDDDADIRESLSDYLRRFDYQVSVAQDTASARAVMEAHDVDLILLDIMMPSEDGLTFCRNIRRDSNIPVIFLTALDDQTDQVVGLELGADDYVTKPFEPRLLLARIKTVLRRAQTSHMPGPAAQQRFGRWQLDTIQGEIINDDGLVVSLSRSELGILNAFLSRPQEVITRDELMALTQGRERHPLERSIDNSIARLRRKIESDPKNPRFIKTVRGGGYKFVTKRHS